MNCMLRKEEILSRTNNGLSVFKHYLPGNWRIGRNFLNPLYEDSKASCNVYFDRHSGMYKMKDFGDDRYSGDCFFLVGQLKRLDCNRASDFIEILATIDRDLGLGLASGIPAAVPPTATPPGGNVPEGGHTRKARQALPVPGTEVHSRRTGILATIRHHARTAGTVQGLFAPGIPQRNGGGKTLRLHVIGSGTHVRLQGQAARQAVPTVLHTPLPLWRQLRRELLLRAGATARQRRHPVYHGWRERRAFAGGAWFPRHLLQQRDGNHSGKPDFQADVPLQAHSPAL